jgi:hypothetical protein
VEDGGVSGMGGVPTMYPSLSMHLGLQNLTVAFWITLPLYIEAIQCLVTFICLIAASAPSSCIVQTQHQTLISRCNMHEYIPSSQHLLSTISILRTPWLTGKILRTRAEKGRGEWPDQKGITHWFLLIGHCVLATFDCFFTLRSGLVRYPKVKYLASSSMNNRKDN